MNPEMTNDNSVIEEVEIEVVNNNTVKQNTEKPSNKLSCSFENIFKNKCCDVFYNNRCFNCEYFKGLIFAFNSVFSILITLGFSIYMFVISGLITFNINNKESTNLKIASIVINIIIFLFAIFLPFCISLCCSNCVNFLMILKFPIFIIGYIIAYILLNIQYHLVFGLNITTTLYNSIILYNNIIVLHIFTGIALLYQFYLIGYYINVHKY